MKSEELYLEAKKVADETGSEARDRAIAHMCYYAAYHLICEHFKLSPKIYAEARHKDVIDRLSSIVTRPGTSTFISESKRYFRSLYAIRIWADYDFDSEFGGNEADRALQICGILFREAKRPDKSTNAF